VATYVYKCKNGHLEETSGSIHTGPQPGTCAVCGAGQATCIQTSLLIFGDFFYGDDDFSRRYWNNGAKESALANKSQGQTGINEYLRKYGKTGLPLELNPHIDPKKSWDTSMGTPPGLDESTEAPIEMQSSSARGMKLSEES
jgi:hypothetical protein